MGVIGVGGDGSVQWLVEAENIREAASVVTSPKKAAGSRKAVRQTGIDEASFDQRFNVSIKVPDGEDPKAFRSALGEAKIVRRKDGSSEIRFEVPIEENTPGQIRVEWKSQT
jgi:hypothetical protein